MSDRTLLAKPSMVSISTRVVDRLPQETPRVGSPPLAPYWESLPQLPRVKIQTPLSLVLRTLMEEPFEPMDRASLKFITLKTVFLVA
jgi:hypothetical protein